MRALFAKLLSMQLYSPLYLGFISPFPNSGSPATPAHPLQQRWLSLDTMAMELLSASACWKGKREAVMEDQFGNSMENH